MRHKRSPKEGCLCACLGFQARPARSVRQSTFYVLPTENKNSPALCLLMAQSACNFDPNFNIMAWQYRKRIKIAPGINLNVSKGGVSTTIGTRGATITTGKNGTYLNTGIRERVFITGGR